MLLLLLESQLLLLLLLLLQSNGRDEAAGTPKGLCQLVTQGAEGSVTRAAAGQGQTAQSPSRILQQKLLLLLLLQ
jgi:hypothetical protein